MHIVPDLIEEKKTPMSGTSEVIKEEIIELKLKKKAVILAHNYQREEVQDIADFVGDSLELSQNAAAMDCEVIVFCGVDFMAESASILSPEKTVLLSEIDATCPMAEMIQVGAPRSVRTVYPGYEVQPTFVFPHNFTLRDIKAQYPGVPVVSYVNTTAEVKAESDVCCTSSNVVRVIESLPDERVICVPDKNLAMWAATHTSKQIIAWDGFCHVHDRVTIEDVNRARKAHPDALLMAHPECKLEVLERSDNVTSTSGMLRFARSSDAREFIVGTELGILHRMRKENPEKTFYPLRNDMICPNMKKTTLNSVLRVLKENVNIIKVPEIIRVPAKRALDRMLELS
jgi:quinolinate synthase